MDRRYFLAGGLCLSALATCDGTSSGLARLIVPGRRPDQDGDRIDADVVVYGTTPAGIVAAVSAANLGASAVLVAGWRDRHLGGMLAGGLGWTDFRDIDAFGGYSRQVIEQLAAAGGMPRNRYAFDPVVAGPVFQRMVRAAGVPVLWADGAIEAPVTDRRIQCIRTTSGHRIGGRMFIDASYEGDLMALAHVAFRTGREAADARNPLNGYRGATNGDLRKGKPVGAFRIHPISPFRADGSGRLLPGVTMAPSRPVGSADDAVQTYCFRLTMTRQPDLRADLPATRPDGYAEEDYEVLLRDIDYRQRQGSLYGRDWTFARDLVKAEEIAPGIYDMNNRGFMSLDAIGLSQNYPGADYAERERIWKAHETYTRGWFHTLAYSTDPRIPRGLQAEVREWGLVKGHYAVPHPNDMPGWPSQLYVREARRLDNGLAWTAEDLANVDGVTPRRGSIVAMASYWQDSHATQRVAVKDRTVGEWGLCNEGLVMAASGGRYGRSPLPFDLMVPHRDQCANLLVPFCVASTHQAFATIRMELSSMALAEAAGSAAALAVVSPDPVDIQDTPYDSLKRILQSNRGVLSGVSVVEDLKRRLQRRLAMAKA
ncbi:MAG: FAD-dependent oxidoreductase [Sphingobium sp.]